MAKNNNDAKKKEEDKKETRQEKRDREAMERMNRLQDGSQLWPAGRR